MADMDAQIKALLANISGMAKEVKALEAKLENDIAKQLNAPELTSTQKAYFSDMVSKVKTGGISVQEVEKELNKYMNGGKV